MNEMSEQPPDLDSIIQQLLEIKGSKPGKQANLSENDIRFVFLKIKYFKNNSKIKIRKFEKII